MNPVDISFYAILDPEHCNGGDLAELATTAAEHGVTLLQYRDKVNDTRQMIGNVREILDAISHTEVPLIINDRVDVALATNADGVHLGQTDMAVEDARTLMGEEKVIGLSIKTLEDAENAPVELLDYAFIGGVFETTSKKNPTAIGLEGWKKRAQILRNAAPNLPLGAIAGITPKNVGLVIESGADGIAVISAVFKADNIVAAVLEFGKIIERAKNGSVS